MRKFFRPLTALAAAALLAACGQQTPPPAAREGAASANSNAGSAPAQSSTAARNTAPPEAVGVAPAHGGAGGGAAPAGAGGPVEEMPAAAAKLDPKVEKAEAKAKSSGANEADKKEAAAAYVERGNVFYQAGNPRLYRYALRDFRRALRYDPSNAEAKQKADQLVEIYESMGRPVPDLGNEP